MTNFKAKIAPNSISAGFDFPRWGSLQRSPDPLAEFGGRFAAGGLGWERGGKGGGEGEEEKWSEGKGRALKLLLNHGPSEPCYATVKLQMTAAGSVTINVITLKALKQLKSVTSKFHSTNFNSWHLSRQYSYTVYITV